MPDDILADVQLEGTPVGDITSENKDEKAETTPSESPAEKAVETETPPPHEGGESEAKPEGSDNTHDDDNVPFHKHPRWKEMIEENKTLKAKLSEVETFQQKVAPIIEQAGKVEPKVEIPEWFTGLYGDDVEVWKKYQTYSAQQRQEIKAEIMREQEEAKKSKEEESKRWTDWVTTSIEAVEQEYGVDLHSDESKRNEFNKFMTEYLPTDRDGNVDFKKGYKLFKELKAKDDTKTQVRKEVAAKTMATGNSETQRDYKTQAELRHKDWFSYPR